MPIARHSAPRRTLRSLLAPAALLGFASLLGGCDSSFDASPSQAVASGPVLVAAAEGEPRVDGFPPSSSLFGDYLAGLVAGGQNDVTAAAEFMLQVHEDDPENYEVLRNAFSLAAADGRHAQATRLARRITEVDQTLTTANLVLAVDEVLREDSETAGKILADLPNTGLNTMVVPLLASWTALNNEGAGSALAKLAPLQDTAGLEALYQMHRALINDVAGRAQEAETAYRAALDISTQPSLRLIWLAGNFFERNGQADVAEETYRSYLQDRPDSILFERALKRIANGTRPAPAIADERGGLAEALFNLASLLSQERAYLMALIHVHQSLRIDPRFDVANLLLGEILQNQARGQNAIAAYRKIDPASPFSWSARMRIADELDRMERSEEAIAELETLAGENPEHFEPLFRIANILRVQERFEDAVVAYDRAFERIGEEDSDPNHWTLYYFRGIALERSKNWQRAEADFLKALELQPEQPYVMNYLAYSWVEQKQNLEEAQRMLIRAVELRPSDGFIVDSLGWVYYRINKYELAVKHLEKAVELRPQDPVINDHLGDAYWQVGRRQEARFQWRRSLSLEPEQDQVSKIEAKIKNGLLAEPENI